MVRETRYLWIGNLPEKITEEKISEKFSGHGKIQSVKLLPGQGGEGCNAIVAFMDIKSASKAHNSENVIESVVVQTQYSEPSAAISQRPTVPAARPHEPEVSSTVTAVKKDVPTSVSSGFATQRNVSGRFPNKQEGHSDDKSTSSRTSFDTSNQFTERGRSKQRFFTGSRGSGVVSGKYDSGSQSLEHVSSRQVKHGLATSPARSEASTHRQHEAKGSRSFSRSRSRSRSSSSGSISSSSRSRSRSKDKAAERKKTLASAVSQPQPKQSDRKGAMEFTGLLIRGFPVRSTDTSVRDGLFHEYKKYGKVTSVSIIDNGNEPRYAVVSFKKPDDAQHAMVKTHNKVFFGSKMSVIPHQGFNTEDSRFRPPEAEQDEYHHKATRTLFVGNLESDVNKEELRRVFEKYGFVIDIDIKKQGTQASYAFVQYDDIKSVVRALRDMDGEAIGKSKVKLGFGKSMPTNCVWLDMISESVSDKFLYMTFNRYGPVTYEVIDRESAKALVYYESLDTAQIAINEMRGRALGGKKIQIDFASVDCQTLFFDNLERQGLLTAEDRPDEKGRFFPGQYQSGFDSRTRFSSTQKGARGAYSRGRGFQRGGRRGFYDRNYEGSFDRRSRYYDEFNADGAEPSYAGDDSYEQELREYYSQREREQPGSSTDKRRESRSDSPSYVKGAHFASPTERYEDRYDYTEQFRDTDSQSGDRESVRSLRSESRKDYKDRATYGDHYAERFSEDNTDSKAGHERHAVSPTNSDYSYRSKSPAYYHHSRSPSPLSIKERKGRSHRAPSPTTPTLDEYEYGSQTESSVDILSGKRDGRIIKKTLKHRDVNDKESDKYDIEDRTLSKSRVGSRIMSHISSVDSDKHSRLYRSKEDLMDIDKSVKSSLYEKHWRSADEPPEKEKVIVDAFQTMRDRKLEKQRSRSASSSGSRSKHRDSDPLKDIYHKDTSKSKTDHFSHPADVPDRIEHTVGSKIVKVDKKLDSRIICDRRLEKVVAQSGVIPRSDSELDSGGDTGPGSDVSHLEHLKLELMKELSQLEEDGSRISAGEDEEGLLRGKKHKKARLEDVFDLDVLKDPALGMKKWRETAKVLAAEFAAEQDQVSSELGKGEGFSQDPNKPYRPLDRSKFKPIDATQSFRKQMEALRKKEQLVAKASNLKAKLLEAKSVPSSLTAMDIDETIYDQSVDKSPEEIPSEFIPKKRRKVVETATAPQDSVLKAHRTYRGRRSEEYVSSGDEGDEAKSHRQGLLHRSSEQESMDTVDNKCDSNKPKHGHDTHETRSGSKDRKSDPRMERQSTGSSVFHRERGTSDPPIIPDSPIEFSDGKSDKRIPQEPRTLRDSIKREPMDLPLPRFARQFNCGIPASPKESPKPLVSPKGPVQSPQMSPALPKLNSPPFSPGIHSPQMSPAVKVDPQMVPPPPPPPQMVPPPTPGDFPLLTLNTLAASASALSATSVQQSSGSMSPPPPPPPPSTQHPVTVTLSPGARTSAILNSPPALLSPVPNIIETILKAVGLDTVVREDMEVSPDSSPRSASPPPPPPPPPPRVFEELLMDSTVVSSASDPIKIEVTTPIIPEQQPASEEVAVKSEESAQETSDSSILKSPEKPIMLPLQKTPPRFDSSSSDLSDFCSPTSPGRPSLEDRIRALDEKLAQNTKPSITTTTVTPGSSTMQTAVDTSASSADYRGKYRVRKKDNYLMGLTPLSTMTLAEQKTSEPSDFVRSILAKSSIFDQDSKRLSGTFDSSQEGHLNLKEAPHQHQVGLNKSANDGLILEDAEHEGLSRFLSSSSLVRQSSVPDNLPQYAGAARLANKLSPPPPPPPPPPQHSGPQNQHSSAYMYASAVSVSPLDPRTMNNIGPAAGSLSGGSSPMFPPNLSRSGSFDSSQLHSNSVGGRMITMNRRPSVEMKPIVSSPYSSSPTLSIQIGPPDLNKVGQYGKDQPQPLQAVNISPTTSIPASVLMPPPALKMVNDTMPRVDAMRRDHISGNANREFLEPPVLKQELKETDLMLISKQDNSVDHSVKRKADTSYFGLDNSLNHSPNKVESLENFEIPVKLDIVEPDSKKLKMSSSNSSLPGEKKPDKKPEISSKTHSSKDFSKKHSSKSSSGCITSNSGTVSTKSLEKKLDKSDSKDSLKSDKGVTNQGKHHIDKTKSHASSNSTSTKANLVPSHKIDHAKPDGKSSEKSKSQNKSGKKETEKATKEHKSVEKRDPKPKTSSNNSNNHGVVDTKQKPVTGEPKHVDRTFCDGKQIKHKAARSESKEKTDSCEKSTPEKSDIASSKKADNKSCLSSGKKHETSQRHDDRNRNDKQSVEKPKERHRSGDSSSKCKPNKLHSVDKPNHGDKQKDAKKSHETRNDNSSPGEKKVNQDKSKSDSKARSESKDRSNKSNKDRNKDSSRSKDVKKTPKNKSTTTPDKNTGSSSKSKDKQEEKSPAPRKREKSGSHCEEPRPDQPVINQEHFNQEELEMLAPFLSMYERVKTRTHKQRDKPDAKMDGLFGCPTDPRKARRSSKPSRSDDTESSMVNTDDESSAGQSGSEAKLPVKKKIMDLKPKNKVVIESSSDEEDIKQKIIPVKPIKASKLKEKKSSWVSSDDSSSDSDSSSGSDAYLKFLTSQQKDNKKKTSSKSSSRKSISQRLSDSNEEVDNNESSTPKKSSKPKSPKSLKKPPVYSSSSSDTDSDSDFIVESSRAKIKTPVKEKKSSPKLNTSFSTPKKPDLPKAGLTNDTEHEDAVKQMKKKMKQKKDEKKETRMDEKIDKMKEEKKENTTTEDDKKPKAKKKVDTSDGEVPSTGNTEIKEPKVIKTSKTKDQEPLLEGKPKKMKKKASEKSNEHLDKNSKPKEKKKKKKKAEDGDTKPKTSVLSETIFMKTTVEDHISNTDLELIDKKPNIKRDSEDTKGGIKYECSPYGSNIHHNNVSVLDQKVMSLEETGVKDEKVSTSKLQRQAPIVIEEEYDDKGDGNAIRGLRPDNIFDLMEDSRGKDDKTPDEGHVKQELEFSGSFETPRSKHKEDSEAAGLSAKKRDDKKKEEEARRKFFERQRHEEERRRKDEERKKLEEERREEERKEHHEKLKREHERREKDRILREQREVEEQKRQEELRKRQEERKAEERRQEEERRKQEEERKKQEEEKRKQDEKKRQDELRRREDERRKYEHMRLVEEKRKLEEKRREEEKREQERRKEEEKKREEENLRLELLKEEKRKEALRIEEQRRQDEQRREEEMRKKLEEDRLEEERRAAELERQKEEEELDLEIKLAQQTASAVASIQHFGDSLDSNTDIASVVEVPPLSIVSITDDSPEDDVADLSPVPLETEVEQPISVIDEAAAATRALLEQLGFPETETTAEEVEIRTAPAEDHVEVIETDTLEPVPTERVEEQVVEHTTVEASEVVTEIQEVGSEVEVDKSEEAVTFSPASASTDNPLVISQESTNDYDLGQSLIIDTTDHGNTEDKLNYLSDDVPKFAGLFGSKTPQKDNNFDNSFAGKIYNRQNNEDQKENQQTKPPIPSDTTFETPRAVTPKVKSPIKDMPPNAEIPKADEFKFDLEKSSLFSNYESAFCTQYQSLKDASANKSGRAKRGRSLRCNRGGKKNAEDKKLMSPSFENEEYHLDAKTGFLSTLSPQKDLPEQISRDHRDKIALAEKEYNFSDVEDDKKSPLPSLHKSLAEFTAKEKNIPSVQNPLHNLSQQELHAQAVQQEQKETRSKRSKAKRRKSDVGKETKEDQQIEVPLKDDVMKDTSPKSNAKQNVPPQYELPTLRKRGDSTTVPPATTPAASTSPGVTAEDRNAAEKFSSRGRKIIPKERDDEVTGISRKMRKVSGKDEPEPKVRGKRGTMPPTATTELESGVKPRRGRKTSLRGVTDEDTLDSDLKDACRPDYVQIEQLDNEVSMEMSTEEGKTPKRRRSQRRLVVGKEDQEKGEKDEDDQEDEASKDGLNKDEAQNSDGSPKAKRARKTKGRKSSDMPLSNIPSPRAQSPRSKSLETGATSPKASDKSKPFVKLEKLNIEETIRREEMRREEEDRPVRVYRGEKTKQVKDLYEWEDEDEEPIPEYTHTRARKQKPDTFESPRKSSVERADESDTKPKDNIPEIVPEPENSENTKPDGVESVIEDVEVVHKQEKTPELIEPSKKVSDLPNDDKPEPSTQTPTTSVVEQEDAPSKEPLSEKPKEEKMEHTGRHLPLKLEMKKEAARAEAAAAVAAATAAAEAEATAKAEAAAEAEAQAEKEAADKLEATKMEAAKLEAAKLEAAKLEAAKLEAAKLEAAKIETAKFEAARFEAARLEMARLETSRLETARKQAEVAAFHQMQSSGQKKSPSNTMTPLWESNMDKVIEEVAKGNFQRGESFDFYKKTTGKVKRSVRNKNRDDTRMEPGCMPEGHPLHVDPSGLPNMSMPGLLSPLNIAVSMGMVSGMGSPMVTQGNLQSMSGQQQSMNAPTDIMMRSPATRTPVSAAMVSPTAHGTTQPGPDANNPMHGMMKAGYRMGQDTPEGRPTPKGKSNDGLIKTPPATLAGQNPAVHIGVVTSQAYGINQRGDSPQGQIIEKVPNPHIQQSGQAGKSSQLVEPGHIMFSCNSQGRPDRDSQSSRPDSRSSRHDSHPGWPEGLPVPGRPDSHSGRPDSHPGRPESYPGRTESYPGRPDSRPGRPDSHPGRPDSHPGRPDSHPGRPDSHPGRPDSHPGRPDSHPGRPDSHPGRPDAYPGLPVNHNIPPGMVSPGMASFMGRQGEQFIPRTQSLPGLPDGFPVRMMPQQPQGMMGRGQENSAKGTNSHGLTPQHSPSQPKEGMQGSHFPPHGLPPHMQGAHPFMPFPMMMSPGVQQVSQQPSPPMSQASELRAALAQPSKLIKQEQMMQRIQQGPTGSQSQTIDNHLQPGSSQDSRQSPNMPGLGQHRMPFTFQEPRLAAVSRAEPKNPQGQFEQRPPQSHGPMHPPQPGSSAFSQPDLRMAMPGDIRPGLTHPDSRPGIPQQMYPPGLPFPPANLAMGLPPRMVLPPNEYLAQMSPHHGLPALIPPQALLAQQPGSSEHHPVSRPPSRRTSSPSQLSPRVATPHQAPTPNPQGASQPVGHTPNIAASNLVVARPSGIDHKMDSMLHMLQRYPVMWQGQLGLKNDTTAVQMHFVAGNKELINVSLPQIQPDGTVAPIRIAQRMRLEQAQLEGVAKRMQNEPEYSMLLAVPCGRDVMDIIQQSSFLKDGFIKYLQDKQAAGIVNVPAPGSSQTAYVVHIFPPCQFSEINVSRLAPDLLQPTKDVAYLLIVVATC